MSGLDTLPPHNPNPYTLPLRPETAPSTKVTLSTVAFYVIASPALILITIYALYKVATGQIPLRSPDKSSSLKNRQITQENKDAQENINTQSNATFDGKILVKAADRNLFGIKLKSARNVETKKIDSFVNTQLKTVKANAKDVSVVSNASRRYLDEGICFGMVVEMAKYMANEEKKTGKSGEQKLISAAQEVEMSMYVDAVANQLFYKHVSILTRDIALNTMLRLEQGSESVQEDPKKLIILYNAVATETNQIKSENIRDLVLKERVKEAEEWYRTQGPEAQELKLVVENLEGLLTPQKIVEGKLEALGVDPKLFRSLETLREIQHQTKGVYKEEFIPKASLPPMKWQPESRASHLRSVLNVQYTAVNNDLRSDRVALSQNLKLESLESQFGLSGESNDEDYLLKKLNLIEEGQYELAVSSRGQMHSTLLVRKEDTFYIWDPREGFGLLELGKVEGGDYGKVQNNIRAYLYTYHDAGERLDDHHLQLRKFIPV